MIRKIVVVFIGVIIMAGLFGCGKQKYKLNFDSSGFESEKTEYAAGEKVTVYYDFIATDTDYHFYSNDVEMKQSYDDQHGYIFTFTMPDHDVTIQVESHNSMMYDPDANKPVVDDNGNPLPDAGGNVWVCPECGTANEGKYCAECGHRKPEE